MYSFGSGVLIGTRTDIANATPVNFGLVQDVTINQTANFKTIHGQYSYPLAGGRGMIKTTGKARVARISGLAFANLFYGVTPATGQIATAFAEAGTVPAVTPFTITVANSATFVDDNGVVYAATGLPFKKVASAPILGQYSVAAGVYTFAAVDASAAVLITYTYTIAASGQKLVITNPLLGTTPTFSALFYTTFQNQPTTLKLNACSCSQLNFGTKLEDFNIPEFDFECFADAANNVMTWSFSEIS